MELDIALPNQPHHDSLRGWQGPYLAGFQRIAAIDKQAEYIPGHLVLTKLDLKHPSYLGRVPRRPLRA